MQREQIRKCSNIGRSRDTADRVEAVHLHAWPSNCDNPGISNTGAESGAYEAVAGDGGAILILMLSCPQDFLRSPAYRKIIAGLLAAMSSTTRFIVCAAFHAPSVATKMNEIFAKTGVESHRIHRVDTGDLKLTPFVQDVCISQTRGGGQIGDGAQDILFLKPSMPRRLDDAEICDRVAAELGYGVKQTDLLFHGGNLLITKRYLLLGMDHFEANVDPLHSDTISSSRYSLPAAFQRSIDTRKELVVLGGTQAAVPAPVVLETSPFTKVHFLHHGALGRAQPLFHVDMFVTPLGRINGRETVVVGKPVPASQHDGQIDFLAHLPFDETVRQLSARGFEVKRIPITTGPKATKGDIRRVSEIRRINETGNSLHQSLYAWGAAASDMVELFEHHVLSWNNVIVENRAAGGLHVTLPSYNHPLDEECAAVYRALGAKVTQLTDCTVLAAMRGSVHCAVRDVLRAPEGHQEAPA